MVTLHPLCFNKYHTVLFCKCLIVEDVLTLVKNKIINTNFHDLVVSMERKLSLTTPVTGCFTQTTSPQLLAPGSDDDNLSHKTQAQQQKSNHDNCNNYNYDYNCDYNCDRGVHSDDHNLAEIRFKLGDRIMLETATGTTGVVTFIRKTNFSKSDVVGIKLDGWNPNASSGIINGEEIVNNHTMHQKTWFLRRCSASNFVAPIIGEGTFARLTRLNKTHQLNGTIVKVISFKPSQSRWKVRVLSCKLKVKERSYLGVREYNLDPIWNWEPKSFAMEYNNNYKDYVPCKIEDVHINDAVQMTNKEWGIVKYISEKDKLILPKWTRTNNGNTQYSKNEQIIGLELIKWSPNANDGCVKGVCYFKVNHGFGYFTCINNIRNIETRYILWKQERLVWIAFDKNIKNSKCLIVKLPKDLIKYILTLVGHRIK